MYICMYVCIYIYIYIYIYTRCELAKVRCYDTRMPVMLTEAANQAASRCLQFL